MSAASEPEPPIAAEDGEPEDGNEFDDASLQEGGHDREPETDSRAVVADDLERMAKADPGVILATRILGGEVVAVRPDGEGS
jgi:hypothetical protein